MLVLAIDPGVTTGFALAHTDPVETRIDYKQLKLTPYEFGEFISLSKCKYFICESFQYRQGQFQKDVLYPVELIGVLKYMEGLLNMKLPDPYNKQVFFQPPATQGKKTAFYSDEKIKDMGLWIPGKDHGRSALKHLLHWFKFNFGATIPHGEFKLQPMEW